MRELPGTWLEAGEALRDAALPVTGLAKIDQCPRAALLSAHVFRAFLEPTQNLVIGRIAHLAFQAWYEPVFGPEPDFAMVLDAAINRFREKAGPAEWRIWALNREKGRKRLLGMLEGFASWQAGRPSPLTELRLRHGRVVGVIDRMEHDPGDGWIIVDYKAVERVPDRARDEIEKQLGGYAWLAERSGYPCREVGILYVLQTKAEYVGLVGVEELVVDMDGILFSVEEMIRDLLDGKVPPRGLENCSWCHLAPVCGRLGG